MTPTNDVSLEIQRKIQTANRCFFGLRKHLQSSHFSQQTKCTLHKTLIRPVLFYGSETWVLTKREENQLLLCDRKVLWKICEEFNSPNALNVTKTSILRYAGHMIRRSEDLPTKSLRDIKEDRNPVGRMGWTAIAWSRGSEIGRSVLKTGRHGEIFCNRP
jgi:hypothetical protein